MEFAPPGRQDRRAGNCRGGLVHDGPASTKKNEIKPHLKQYWVTPPKQSSDSVAAMEDVLEVYKRPYDQNVLVVCMDEQPTQLIKETRTPIAMGPGHAQRVDYGKHLAI